MARRVGSPARAAAVAALLIALGACGGDVGDGEGSAVATLLTTPPTTYALREPDTTTTTTEVPVQLPSDEPTSGGSSGPATPDSYTVQSGDSVYKIANRFGLDPAQLAAYNGWSDGVNHTINPGDVVRIPSDEPPTTGGSTPDGGTAPPTAQPPSGDCPTTYTIQEGDTTRIKVASRFGITWQEMDAANTSTPGYDNFLIGTVINIPCPS